MKRFTRQFAATGWNGPSPWGTDRIEERDHPIIQKPFASFDGGILKEATT